MSAVPWQRRRGAGSAPRALNRAPPLPLESACTDCGMCAANTHPDICTICVMDRAILLSMPLPRQMNVHRQPPMPAVRAEGRLVCAPPPLTTTLVSVLRILHRLPCKPAACCAPRERAWPPPAPAGCCLPLGAPPSAAGARPTAWPPGHYRCEGAGQAMWGRRQERGKRRGAPLDEAAAQLCAASPLGRLPSPLRLAAALSSIDNRLNCAHILASQDPTIIDAVVSDHRNVTAMIG